jgi:hypothetical protein
MTSETCCIVHDAATATLLCTAYVSTVASTVLASCVDICYLLLFQVLLQPCNQCLRPASVDRSHIDLCCVTGAAGAAFASFVAVAGITTAAAVVALQAAAPSRPADTSAVQLLAACWLLIRVVLLLLCLGYPIRAARKLPKTSLYAILLTLLLTALFWLSVLAGIATGAA